MPIKLLFVDDNRAFEQSVKLQFKQEIVSGKYEIIFTHTPQSALDALERDEEHEIALLLTELKLSDPQMNGIQLIRTIRHRGIKLKTIIITAQQNTENYLDALRENVLLVMIKPIEVKQLKLIIEEALKKREAINTSSTKVRLNTLLRVLNELPSRQKEKVIYELVSSLDQRELERIEQQLPSKLQEQMEKNERKVRERAEMIDKLRRGDIDPNVPFQLLEGHFIEERYIPRDGKNFGPYYYLRWSEDGKLKTKYLGKNDPRKGGMSNSTETESSEQKS